MNPPNPTLTHFDAAGEAHMVDVGDKPATHRVAVATGSIIMLPATLALVQSGQARKGDSLHGWARALGIPVEDACTGADVAELYAAGQLRPIVEHCESDVLITAVLYDRLLNTHRI